MEPFLPVVDRLRQWKDRRKRVAFPLFPGYCFARFPLSLRVAVLTTAGFRDLLSAARQRIREIDLNPVIVGAEGEGVAVVDALMVQGTRER